MVEQYFLECARAIGVEQQIEALRRDCDQAIADYPVGGGRRWLGRLEDQRRRLLHPDLPTIVAVATCLAEDAPSLAPLVAAAMKALVLRYPHLKPFRDRLVRAGAVADKIGQAR